MHDAPLPYRTCQGNSTASSGLSGMPREETHHMAGMRDYTEAELDLVRESFSGRYALRDRCYFQMSLQMGLRVSEMLSLTVGQVFQYRKVVDEVSIERKHMKGGKAGKSPGVPFRCSPRPTVISSTGCSAWLRCCTSATRRRSPPQRRSFSPASAQRMGASGQSPGKRPGASLKPLPARMNSLAKSIRTRVGRP